MTRRTGLAAQVTVLTCAAALVAALLTGMVGVQAVRGAYDARARQSLQAQAELLASATSERPLRAGVAPTRRAVREILARTGVQVLRVGPQGTVAQTLVEPEPAPAAVQPGQVPSDVLAAAQNGQRLSAVREIAGSAYLVEVVPLPASGGVVLLQRGSDARAVERTVLRRLALALLLGLLVAAVVGAVLARRLARPLVAAADAARLLAAGRRELRLPEDGSAEVAELSADLNALAGALTRSEHRQRDFLLSVSHELRTPLTAVRGFAEALADGVVTGPDAQRAGQLVGQEAQRLQCLVDDLLALARLQADDFRLEPAVTDLDALLADAAETWTARCAAVGVHLRVERPQAPVWARTDPGRVRQIVDGLAENALRVTPQGSPLTFTLRTEPEAAVLQVLDSGPGLTDDDLAVAFEQGVLHARYRAVRPVGTGLGLALVAGLAARLGASVQAGHAPGGGAAFCLRIPTADRPVHDPNVAHTASWRETGVLTRHPTPGLQEEP